MRKDLSIQEIKDLAAMVSNLPNTKNAETVFQPSDEISKLLKAYVTFSKRDGDLRIMVEDAQVYHNADILCAQDRYNHVLTLNLISLQAKLVLQYEQTKVVDLKESQGLTRLLGLDSRDNGGKYGRVYVGLNPQSLVLQFKLEGDDPGEYTVDQFLEMFLKV